MKVADIQVGRAYTDGKGRRRQITDKGSHLKVYPGQNEDIVCVQYQTDNKTATCTLAAFASWAKQSA